MSREKVPGEMVDTHRRHSGNSKYCGFMGIVVSMGSFGYPGVRFVCFRGLCARVFLFVGLVFLVPPGFNKLRILIFNILVGEESTRVYDQPEFEVCFLSGTEFQVE